jgi:hypothetical protein
VHVIVTVAAATSFLPTSKSAGVNAPNASEGAAPNSQLAATEAVTLRFWVAVAAAAAAAALKTVVAIARATWLIFTFM